ncbi:hypothetical protein [Halomonas sp.]|uniref:hypothetical protein n=1 Tax=Halomonas sp. TaxID=1486246 RepID=UPI00298DDBE9|nr:hypothetical protein [Halomonas sp.]MDW7746739.1 hypothetical protein [Halomonas sp.]
MTINTPPRLQPVSTTAHSEPALLVDEAASPEALYLEADARLTAAQGMLLSAALAGDSNSLEGHDVANIAQAAQILTSDALDLMRAMHEAHQRATAQQQAPRTVHHFGQGK